jgi:membrane-bound serine protease (ClpP class)
LPEFDLAGWFRLDPWAIALLSVVVAAFVALVIWRGIRVHRGRVSAGREDLVGKTAKVRTALEPEGTVFIQGEHWTAVSEEGRVEPGEEVVIAGVDNLVLRVIPSRGLPSRGKE